MTFWPRISYVMSTHSGSGGLFPMRSRGRNDSANSSYAQCTKVSAVNFFWQEPCRQQVDVNFYLAHALFHIRVFTISSAPRSTLFHVPFMSPVPLGSAVLRQRDYSVGKSGRPPLLHSAVTCVNFYLTAFCGSKDR